MTIRTDEQLAATVLRASQDIQDIQNYLGQNDRPSAKIAFPYGYIRIADSFRKQWWFIRNPDLRSNICYTLILSDVYRWLINRTSLVGTAREMVLKQGIAVLGSVIESSTKDVLRGHIGKI